MHLLLQKFFTEMTARINGPLGFRFIIQPVIAVVLGMRDGNKDAKAGSPPFIFDLVFNPSGRSRNIKMAWQRLAIPLIIAVVLDAIAQYLIFRWVRPAAAVLVGTLVMGLPYALSRGATNRIIARRKAE